ncbi:cysteine desulfurase family protein [Cellulomonas bogoriensis]|uniref:Aminotransferase V n=1 Tax=Cellulomonas bogoriensis 69B4 = DSM 16987 TaxID=1386082 RepID=A0A0A0BZ28_9CELL|nr:aminotransferase class V-fold PLP-dependent enzyme [Cellulomonas bogoriensis]KGM12957.1 aminotransferase V [Cellulomonas bogoriensis 69B4 = DSM 16987]
MTPSRVYLDAGGRAPLHPVARAAYEAAADEGWADPRRLHAEGRRARLLLDAARETLAAEVGARTDDVHLGPGVTTALHHAVLGSAAARRRVGATVVTSAVERAAVHAAARFVVEPVRAAADQAVGEPPRVPVDRNGRVEVDRWRAAVSAPGVAVAVLQQANGEVGTRQPVEAAYEACAVHAVPLVLDATCALGHEPVSDHWDVLVADPADWGAFPGAGLVVTRPRTRTARAWPEDEDRWFPGGADVPSAVAAAASLRAVVAEQERAGRVRRELVDLVRSRVAADLTDVAVVGDPVDRLPHVVTFSLLYVDGEAILTELDRRGYAVGSGSACVTGTTEPSHVLRAMGTLTQGNVRLSLPVGISREEVTSFLAVLPQAVDDVRRMVGGR